jgi:hypothetical protein
MLGKVTFAIKELRIKHSSLPDASHSPDASSGEFWS